KFSLNGKDISTDAKQGLEMSWTIKSVDTDGKASVTLKAERFQVAMEMPVLGKFEYDSKEGKMPKGPFGKMFEPIAKALAGAEFSLTMDPRGEVSDVKIPENVEKALKGQKAPGLADMLSPESLKKMMSVVPLPKEAINKGKTWTQKIDMKTAA